MHKLTKQELDEVFSILQIDNSQYQCFVETGTFLGATILSMINHFNKLYTIEVSKEIYDRFNKNDYDRNKLTSVLGDSAMVMGDIIPRLDGNTVFFLDGHYSSCDTGKGIKDVPLNEELTTISKNFPYDAVIIIDDLRLFGTNHNEDWSDIKKETLTSIVGQRLEATIEKNDRLILKLRSVK